MHADSSNPVYAKMLEQALGGIEGKFTSYAVSFQVWSSRGAFNYCDMLLETGAEEMDNVEMYATAIVLNLEGSPAVTHEAAATEPDDGRHDGGMSPRQYLSAGIDVLCAGS